MLIELGFDIGIVCPAPTHTLLALDLRPEREADLVRSTPLTVSTGAPLRAYTDGFGNRIRRVTLPAGETIFSWRGVIRDSGEPDEIDLDAREDPIEDLPDEVLVYTLGSRYCETDKLGDEAWRLFGSTPRGWARVQAIVDYAHERLRFSYPDARATRSAHEGHEERLGVCRDFAHLAVTLCRAMNIPARYVTGYLGDIGVPRSPDPMDFSAWVQVWLGGRWCTFDARHNRPRIGRVLMAVGRDATDVALVNTFGPHTLSTFKVVTDEAESLEAAA